MVVLEALGQACIYVLPLGQIAVAIPGIDQTLNGARLTDAAADADRRARGRIVGHHRAHIVAIVPGNQGTEDGHQRIISAAAACSSL